jgi:hypothetical protein
MSPGPSAARLLDAEGQPARRPRVPAGEGGRQSRPTLPVLFITGYAAGAARRSEMLGPGMDMITKPFAVEALAQKISEMIAG